MTELVPIAEGKRLVAGREIPMNLDGKTSLSLMLYIPDFTTARRVSDAINTALGQPSAKMLDSGTIEVLVPENRRLSVVGAYDTNHSRPTVDRPWCLRRRQQGADNAPRGAVSRLEIVYKW